MTIHHIKANYPNKKSKTTCGILAANVGQCTGWQWVTCKNCLKKKK